MKISEAVKLMSSTRMANSAEGTRIAFERAMRVFMECLGDRHVETLTTQDMTVLVAHIYRLPGKHANSVYSRMFMRYMAAAGYIARNPMALVPQVRLEKPKPKVGIEHDEYLRLLEAAGDRPIRIVVQLGWYTGMALIDCCTIKWKHVDLHRLVIEKHRQKTGSLSVIPFARNGDLHRTFLELRDRFPLNRNPEDKIHPAFTSDSDSMRVLMHGLFRKAGIVGKSFHCFRVSMATNLLDNRVPLHDAMRITGHTSPAIFMGYAKSSTDGLRRAIDSVRYNLPTGETALL